MKTGQTTAPPIVSLVPEVGVEPTRPEDNGF